MTRKKERGQLIVLSGPSGVGKSTLIAELLGQRDSEDVSAGRLETARQEFREIPKYDYLVINDKVSNAVEEIAAILTAAECRVPNRSHMLAQFA